MQSWKSNPYFTRLLVFNLLLITVIGIVPLVVVFQYMMSAYSSELQKFNLQSVRQVQAAIDDQILKPTVEAANRSLTEASSSEPPLLYPMNHSIRGDYSSMTAITANLASIKSGLSFAGSVDMYYRNNDVFFYDTKFFCFVNESDCRLGFRERWLEQFRQADTQVAWYTIDAADNPDGERLVSYVRSYPYFAAPDKRKAIFAVNLKESAIRKKLIKTLDPASGLTFIVDSAGRLVSSSGTGQDEAAFLGEPSLRKPAPDEGKQDMLSVKWEGKAAVAAFADSGINGWRYVTVVEKSVFYKRASDIRNFMYVLGGALLAAGIVLVYLLTMKAHKPIGRAIREYSLRIDDLHDQLSRNEPVIKYHSLMNLLTGSGEGAAGGSPTDMQRFLDLELRRPYFLCFVLLPQDGADGESQSGVASAYRMIEQLEAASPPESRVWAIMSQEGRIYGIMNGESGDAGAMEGALVEKVSGIAGETCRLCLGSRRRTAETAPSVSYREACEAAEYVYFYPERPVIRHADLQLNERQSGGGPVKALDDLAGALRAADEGRAQSSIRAIVGETMSERYTAEYGRHLLKELVFIFRKTLKSMGIDTRELFGCEIREYAESIRDIHEFSRWIGEAVETALRHIEARRKGVDPELDVRVKAFIEEHLYGELSLDRVAEHIGVTPNYLSRLFKLSTGVTFIDYITGLKLEAAAGLLRDNQYNVNEIALMLGYHSTNHFIRIFKEKYGQTPKQYYKAGIRA